MKIWELFAKPIDRDLQGVINVGEDKQKVLEQELEEYVVTRELQKRFADFFSAYKKGIIGNTSKIGVWISGFFGSGKSHLLEIISYLLANKDVCGKKPIDYFIEDNKITDQIVLSDMKLAANTPTDVILFDIQAKTKADDKGKKDALVNVFLQVFNDMQGFCTQSPVVADLERRLSEEGRYEEFKKKYEDQAGESWEESRSDFDYMQDELVDVLANMGFMSEEAARNWCEKLYQPYSISIEDFAKRVKKYIDRKGNNHHVVFAVDEVGQYIGDDRSLMLELQTIEEELANYCEGKAWLIVTSQQDVDSVIKVIGNDFSKIAGRFDTRLSLSSANADTVIRKRILAKKDVPAQTLRLLYGEAATDISNKITFTDTNERKLYSGAEDFAEVYPFIPYQFNLLASVLTAVRTHGASGKHLSEGERSMLAMFKESASNFKEKDVGTLIPFYAFYDPMEDQLDHSHRSVIIKAYENDYINPGHTYADNFTIDVLKVLFLIKYVGDITANLDNITTLMISNIADDRISLRKKVEDSLKILIRQMLVQKNGEIYIFLTDEEQEINREIESEDVDNSEVINKVSEVIFDDIFTDKKYRYPAFNGRYSFGFNQIVDDRPYKTTAGNDIAVHILTPAAEIQNEIALRGMSMQGKEVLVVLPNDRTFMDEIQTYLKIEKFLRSHTTSSGISKYESIKDGKRTEMRERSANAKLFLTEALKEADIYINGEKSAIKSKDVGSRMEEALGHLVQMVYHKLSYIDAAMGEGDIRKLFTHDNQISMTLEKEQEPNHLALDEVLRFVSGNSSLHMKTSMKSIREKFMKAPYGFVEDDVSWLVAKLFRRGDLAFTVNGTSVSLLNKTEDDIINYITKKQYVEKLMVEQRIRIPEREKKACRKIMNELFHNALLNDDEDALMQSFQHSSNKLLTELRELMVRYEDHPYPGKTVVQDGIKLLMAISQCESVQEFYKEVSRHQEAFEDFAQYYQQVREFFQGEQKGIFDRALKLMKIYDDSKTYIVNRELETTVHEIKDILKRREPYSEIHRLPELLEEFSNLYTAILEEQEIPVLNTINDDYKRVMDVLSTKSYVAEKKAAYGSRFQELRDGLERCNNISVLRSYADKADALKIRLLNEMTDRDNEIARKKAEEKQRQEEQSQNSNGDGIEPPAPVVEPHIKTTKNVSIKAVIGTSSWRLESAEDVNQYVDSLRRELLNALDDDTIINIEF